MGCIGAWSSREKGASGGGVVHWREQRPPWGLWWRWVYGRGDRPHPRHPRWDRIWGAAGSVVAATLGPALMGSAAVAGVG